MCFKIVVYFKNSVTGVQFFLQDCHLDYSRAFGKLPVYKGQHTRKSSRLTDWTARIRWCYISCFPFVVLGVSFDEIRHLSHVCILCIPRFSFNLMLLPTNFYQPISCLTLVNAVLFQYQHLHSFFF